MSFNNIINYLHYFHYFSDVFVFIRNNSGISEKISIFSTIGLLRHLNLYRLIKNLCEKTKYNFADFYGGKNDWRKS